MYVCTLCTYTCLVYIALCMYTHCVYMHIIHNDIYIPCMSYMVIILCINMSWMMVRIICNIYFISNIYFIKVMSLLQIYETIFTWHNSWNIRCRYHSYAVNGIIQMHIMALHCLYWRLYINVYKNKLYNVQL